MVFFLRCQAGELLPSWVIWQQEGLLAMEDWRIGTLAVVVAVDLTGPQVHSDGTQTAPGEDRPRTWDRPGTRVCPSGDGS